MPTDRAAASWHLAPTHGHPSGGPTPGHPNASTPALPRSPRAATSPLTHLGLLADRMFACHPLSITGFCRCTVPHLFPGWERITWRTGPLDPAEELGGRCSIPSAVVKVWARSHAQLRLGDRDRNVWCRLRREYEAAHPDRFAAFHGARGPASWDSPLRPRPQNLGCLLLGVTRFVQEMIFHQNQAIEDMLRPIRA